MQHTPSVHLLGAFLYFSLHHRRRRFLSTTFLVLEEEKKLEKGDRFYTPTQRLDTFIVS